jgi:flagellar FliL protein
MAEQPAEAKDKDAAKNAAPDEASAGKKGKGKLFVILGVVFILLLGGGAGAFFMLRKPADPNAPDAKKDAAKKEATGIVNFEPFVVNLADEGKRRFLRINVRLIVENEEEAEHITKSEVIHTRLRADILDLLTQQTSDHITTADGKAALKKEISERAHHILHETEVADVLFSDLVVQY